MDTSESKADLLLKDRAKVRQRCVELKWSKVTVDTIPQKKKKLGLLPAKNTEYQNDGKRILHSISGHIPRASITALMGASGAGKSTMLNTLAQRNLRNLKVDGKFKVNGERISKQQLGELCAYVQQQDTFIGQMTVREHIWFQVKLRLGHLNRNEQEEKVAETLKNFGLSKCENTTIGIPGRIKGISGGEMKRLSVASEVLNDPPLLFCDEPTTGLDSYMAEKMIRMLKLMTLSNKTVLCTIHQPSSHVYKMFDKVILLAEGRKCFEGDGDQMLEFFSHVGLPCPDLYNPADHVIHSLSILPGKELERTERALSIAETYKHWRKNNQYLAHLDTEVSETDDRRKAKLPDHLWDNLKPKPASIHVQFMALLWRCWILNTRDTRVFKIRMLQMLALTVIINLVYWNQQYTQAGVMNLNGVLWIIQSNMSFQNAFATLRLFLDEVDVLVNERSAGLYRTSVYYLCKAIATIPPYIILPALWVALNYWTIGLYPYWKSFLIAMAAMIVMAEVTAAYGCMIAQTSRDLSVITNFGVLFNIATATMSGLFFNIASTPAWLAWLPYLGWYRYSNEILVVNQWEHVTNITCEYTDKAGCFQTGDDVIRYFHFNEATNVPIDFICLSSLGVAFHLIGYSLLRIRLNFSK